MVRAIASRFKRNAILMIRKRFFELTLCDAIVNRIDRKHASMSLGRRGELVAERYLLKQGYWIIDHSFGEKVGEIDLIASDGNSVIFVEVKARTSDVAGDPTEAVDLEKQRHITQTARLFAVKNRLENSSMRFDVISILWPDLSKSPNIKHFQNAFAATGDFQMF
jgi:putative endonuclease